MALGSAQPALPQTDLPDTPAGRQLGAWLTVFNNGDPAQLEAFMRESYPSSHDPLAYVIESRRATGGYELIRIDSAGETELAAVVRERDWPSNFARMAVEVESQSPNVITEIGLARANRPADVEPVARMSEADALSALRDKLEQAGAQGVFSGAIMVARDGQPLLTFAAGEADRERGIPNGIDTKFRIGSMNKMFTAVAILQLVEAGEVALSAPIGTYLTAYPNPDAASRVTVEHLLTHTGGTGDIFGPELAEHRDALREHSDYVAVFGARDLAFPPGERFAYSNYGYVLLGAIVEAVTGQSYYDYVRENIYVPAGMTGAGSLPENVEVPGRAVSYTTLTGHWRSTADTLFTRGTAAGGGYATVGDLIAFSEALRSGVLLNRETLEAATRTQVEIGPGAGYGYGFYDYAVNGARAFSHGGAAAGMDAQLLVFPESGYAIAVAANRDAGVTRRAATFIAARLPSDASAR